MQTLKNTFIHCMSLLHISNVVPPESLGQTTAAYIENTQPTVILKSQSQVVVLCPRPPIQDVQLHAPV